MSLWTITLILGYALILIVNLIFSFSLMTALNFVICAAIIMVPAALFLGVGRLLPKGQFSENNKLFRIGKFKQKVCQITGVKQWKDSIPVGGRVAGFRLNRLANPKDIEYLNRFIYESCVAQWLHTIVCYYSIVACLIIYLINKSWVFPMAVPISIVWIYQNMTSTIIQWYMRPRIVKLKQSLIKHSECVAKEIQAD